MPVAEHATAVAPLVNYDVTEAQIATLREEYAGLTCDTPQGYEAVRVAIGQLRTIRTTIEKRRVELKADALAFGRLVDSEARRFTLMAEEIEEPLKAKKAIIDDEAARVKREAEAEKLRALEAEIAANRARQEAEAKALRDAEEARLAVERKALEAERAALAEERRQADEAAKVQREAATKALLEREAAQRAEGEALRAELKRNREADEAAARVERGAIEQERRKVAAEREKAERIEFERQAKIKAEAEAIAKAERDRLAAAEQAARIAALAPDVEKVKAFAAAIRALPVPKGRTKDAKTVISDAVDALGRVAADLETFGVA